MPDDVIVSAPEAAWVSVPPDSEIVSVAPLEIGPSTMLPAATRSNWPLAVAVNVVLDPVNVSVADAEPLSGKSVMLPDAARASVPPVAATERDAELICATPPPLLTTLTDTAPAPGDRTMFVAGSTVIAPDEELMLAAALNEILGAPVMVTALFENVVLPEDGLTAIDPVVVCRVSDAEPGVIAPPPPWMVSVAEATVGPSDVLPEYALPPFCHTLAGVDPVAPVAPAEPVAPVEPVEPVAPVLPVAPVEPVLPVEPVVAPVGPVAPVAPVAPVPPPPVAPVAPVDPVLPVAPVEPVAPPVGPDAPVEPVAPVLPVAPVEPVLPVAPVEPVEPVELPVAPVGPVAPVPPPPPPPLPRSSAMSGRRPALS